MEIVMQIVTMMILLELFEIYIQRADTLREMIDNLYYYYNRSVFLFFLVHPTFYYVLGVTLYFDTFNFYSITILVLKALDLFFKVELIKQRYYEPVMDAELEKMMELKITLGVKFLAPFTYVPLLYLSIMT